MFVAPALISVIAVGDGFLTIQRGRCVGGKLYDELIQAALSRLTELSE